jgi:hypothetical protein
MFMGYQLYVYGVSVVCLWGISCMFMGYQLYVYGVSVVCLRGLTAETFKCLRLPVEEFLSIQNAPSGRSFVCSGTITFEEAIQQLVSQSTHRLWVENSDHFPVGVVALSDVCGDLGN